MKREKKRGADEAVRKAKRDQQDLDIRSRLSHIKHKILVMSGKGGVGKSSVAAYLAASLASRGYRVGLMDVDLHGPSIPRLLGIRETLLANEVTGRIHPVRYRPNLQVISIEVLTGDRDAATIWRGPLKGGVIRQFIADIEWMDLDYMIIDSPPGTGDEPLTVAQTISDARTVIVTTPQEVSLADVRKAINFCRHVKMEILGLIENMSGLTCPRCGEPISLFGSGGGGMTAEAEGLTLLGVLPIDPLVVESGDAGRLDLLENRNRPWSQAFARVVDEVESRMGAGLPAGPSPAQIPAAGQERKGLARKT